MGRWSHGTAESSASESLRRSGMAVTKQHRNL
ncbi:hypothetical protein FB470_003243 [Amycolatopsis thermophila]|uniref:Uncharacterized protein n=1 Tax=Amycolatopsis thermophila TaxID=206084 RepID=A0ABU0EVA9_9PSEU|nr:hypothetical protein [Amycolatopsis thermophila]